MSSVLLFTSSLYIAHLTVQNSISLHLTFAQHNSTELISNQVSNIIYDHVTHIYIFYELTMCSKLFFASFLCCMCKLGEWVGVGWFRRQHNWFRRRYREQQILCAYKKSIFCTRVWFSSFLFFAFSINLNSAYASVLLWCWHLVFSFVLYSGAALMFNLLLLRLCGVFLRRRMQDE